MGLFISTQISFILSPLSGCSHPESQVDRDGWCGTCEVMHHQCYLLFLDIGQIQPEPKDRNLETTKLLPRGCSRQFIVTAQTPQED